MIALASLLSATVALGAAIRFGIQTAVLLLALVALVCLLANVGPLVAEWAVNYGVAP